MGRLSVKRHGFPAKVTCHAVWRRFRFALSFRDVEKLLAQRGIGASHETVGCWTIKFRPQIAANLRLAEAGCTTLQICAITGHETLKEISRYTAAADQERMARDAVDKLAR